MLGRVNVGGGGSNKSPIIEKTQTKLVNPSSFSGNLVFTDFDLNKTAITFEPYDTNNNNAYIGIESISITQSDNDVVVSIYARNTGQTYTKVVAYQIQNAKSVTRSMIISNQYYLEENDLQNKFVFSSVTNSNALTQVQTPEKYICSRYKYSYGYGGAIINIVEIE